MRRRCRSPTRSRSSRCSTARRFARRSRSTSPTSSSPRSRRSTPRRSPSSKSEGWRVVPSAKAVQLTMNRDGIRDFAAQRAWPRHLAIPLRRKPRGGDRRRQRSRAAVRGQAGHVELGQGPDAPPRTTDEVGAAWDYAVANMRGDRPRVIVEEFIKFDSEITLADRRDQGRRPVLRARSAIARKRATIAKAGSRPAIPDGRAAFGAAPGAQGGRGARRPRHLRRRILHPRRPGDLLRAVARARTTPAWSR